MPTDTIDDDTHTPTRELPTEGRYTTRDGVTTDIYCPECGANAHPLLGTHRCECDQEGDTFCAMTIDYPERDATTHATITFDGSTLGFDIDHV